MTSGGRANSRPRPAAQPRTVADSGVHSSFIEHRSARPPASLGPGNSRDPPGSGPGAGTQPLRQIGDLLQPQRVLREQRGPWVRKDPWARRGPIPPCPFLRSTRRVLQATPRAVPARRWGSAVARGEGGGGGLRAMPGGFWRARGPGGVESSLEPLDVCLPAGL
jgi:hypothetical protein